MKKSTQSHPHFAHRPRNRLHSGREQLLMRIIATCLVAYICVICPTVARAAEPALRVSAAISLKDALEAIIDAYQSETGLKVELNLGASGQLMEQIRQGAPDRPVYLRGRQAGGRPDPLRAGGRLHPAGGGGEFARADRSRTIRSGPLARLQSCGKRKSSTWRSASRGRCPPASTRCRCSMR